ncbi:acyl-CoA dehydrogenase family protein [Saccharopolyspora indica]|uniref:acyl-CoA dehydrogenase family protein n=1 Tax=Saccharopolyspora indica TaxID=1229659 RepID=UPI0022EAA739|nr:acyl-CoA dehydrogenase family protein [Saccharopolyspora indica]MDA3642983.1 acyl-CoA dehydrogenase family protein [Saccharopolyspora indica]
MSREDLAARFRPVFERIADGAADRERQRRLPHEEVGWLRAAGFGAIRVPRRLGGAGAGLDELFGLLVELGEADSNLPQALRPHVLFVEEQLRQPASAEREEWLRLVAAGTLVGNAISERDPHEVGRLNTRLSEKDGRLVLNGTKYYATGSLFAEWLTVRAERAPGELVVARVPAHADGLVQRDDWDGFGQRTTASGTVEFTDVEVDAAHVVRWDRGPGLHTALAQLVLLASLVGVARAAAREATGFVRERRRSYSHASAPLPKDDPLVQQVVGKIHSAAFAAQATLEAAVASVRRAQEGAQDDVIAAEDDVAKAQVAIADVVLRAAAELFEVGGSSVVSETRQLDRHWRNARTLTVHNPLIYKSRAVGDHAINDALPVFGWTTGAPA